MDTPDPTPRSWPQLAAAARAQQPPAIDARRAVRAAILAESAAEAPASWSEGLLEFLRVPWARISLAGAVAAAILLCASGWWALSREMSDPIAIALGDNGSSLFASTSPP